MMDDRLGNLSFPGERPNQLSRPANTPRPLLSDEEWREQMLVNELLQLLDEAAKVELLGTELKELTAWAAKLSAKAQEVPTRYVAHGRAVAKASWFQEKADKLQAYLEF